MKYDFDRIDTAELSRTVNNYVAEIGGGCGAIYCGGCPFKDTEICRDNPKLHRLFKAELERR